MNPEEEPQHEPTQLGQSQEQQQLQPEQPQSPPQPAQPENTSNLTFVSQAVDKVRHEVKKIIIGQDNMIDLMLIGLFTGGHLLMEGVPGIAKTLSVKMMAKTLSTGFSRIQFTPDLMPTDIIGTSVFNMQTSAFTFNHGPIFSNIVLADEINRSPAKTQAALFEVMEERQITVDGTTYPMDFPFMVIATQNPIEQEGTYKLPEAQLDRFLFRIKLFYPTLEEEQQILKRFREDFRLTLTEEVKPVLTSADVERCQKAVEQVYIKDELLNYIAAIIHNTRNNGDLFLGASPRASLAIMRGAKASAAMQGRNFVTPDDVKFVAAPVLNHRLILSSERELEGVEVEEIIKGIIEKIEVPR